MRACFEHAAEVPLPWWVRVAHDSPATEAAAALRAAESLSPELEHLLAECEQVVASATSPEHLDAELRRLSNEHINGDP
ncbi:hypothetical protein [Haloechinothrix halophila]|uniref:hypothetical protein n=1 Tax=Haloechinothrix halophila TaxID=1069073 RepID=UPI000400910D|nr:hypothetical protein [Haloechinothrix halophila]